MLTLSSSMLAVQSATVIFHTESCKVLSNRTVVSGMCPFVMFPNHPQKIHRQPCNAVLLKTMRTSSGSTTLYPCKIFCCKSVIESLKEMLQRPGFGDSELYQMVCLQILFYDRKIGKNLVIMMGYHFFPYHIILH